MPINVRSEIAPLKKVMLHRPGKELEQLVPNALERLLFDDIPYLQGAQQEHDRFAQILREQGVEVVYLSELAAQTLGDCVHLREQFVHDFIRYSGAVAQSYERELSELLLQLPTHEMVLKTMTGVRFDELPKRSTRTLTSLRSCRNHFVLDPIPNLYFTRDPFASIGHGATVNRMYSQTRNRETIYSHYFLRYHPDFAGKVPFYFTPEESFSLEGG
ncbi:MAG: arginine deiminase, partial [Oscillospiraceae bacterium]|nr:arginine deiminase [Oscillospiraceae bacterium]